jgi:hypothetical protein
MRQTHTPEYGADDKALQDGLVDEWNQEVVLVSNVQFEGPAAASSHLPHSGQLVVSSIPATDFCNGRGQGRTNWGACYRNTTGCMSIAGSGNVTASLSGLSRDTRGSW